VNPVTWLMLVGVCGFVWGGFVYFLIRGMRSEAAKSSRESEGKSDPLSGGHTEL